MPAVPADSLVDAYGLGIHTPFLDTPYADAERVADALEDLGVRHVRDDLFLDADLRINARQAQAIRTIADRGVTFNLIMGRPDRPGSPEDYVRAVTQLPAGAVTSVEGINEWDHFGPDGAWVLQLADWQARLYASIKTTPETRGLPVLSPALAFRNNYGLLPDLSPFSDVANVHIYPGGKRPGTEERNVVRALLAVLDRKPLVTTETGYHNALNALPNVHRPVSERAAALYHPRLLLEHVQRGHLRTYAYELIDSVPEPFNARVNPESHFGLLRRDWSPKPAYTAMKTLLGLLDDPGPAFTPKPLELARVAKGWPGDGRWMVTQKRDGTYVLLGYRDVDVWDTTANRDLPLEPSRVTLDFTRDYGITVHRVSEGAEPVSSSVGSSVEFDLDGGVTAITLDPDPQSTSDPQPSPDPEPTPDPEPEPVANPAKAPTRPGAVTTVTRGKRVAVRWRAARPRGSAVDRYRVRLGKQVKVVGGKQRRVVFRGVRRDVRLLVAVRARNDVGWGAPRRVWRPAR